MKPIMTPLSVVICVSGLLTFSGCRDTLFNTKGGKLVKKEGSGNNENSKNLEGDTNGDGLLNEEDANNRGENPDNDEDSGNKGKNFGDNDEDTLGGGKNGKDGEDSDLGNKSRRNRPGLGLLQALNGSGGDTPLALDWNQDGTFKTTFSEKGNMVSFDLNASGVATPVEWLKPEDRWLALDLNHDGKIASGAELFGSSTTILGTLPLSLRADDGFEALAQYDSNHDGVINRLDPIFSQLLLWQDKNSNGLSELGELTKLASTQVESLSVNGIPVDAPKETLEKSTAYIGLQSTYLINQNGKMKRHRLVDLYFPNFYKTLSKN